MTIETFTQAAHVGLGRVFAADIRSGRYDETIADLLRINYAYDVQSEGNRDWYAVELLQRSPNVAALIEEFSAYLLKHPQDLYWGYKRHIFAVAHRLFRKGLMEAATIIEAFKNTNDGGDDDVDGAAFLPYLGAEGLQLYLKTLGEELLVDERAGRSLPWSDDNYATVLQLAKDYGLIESADPVIQAAIQALRDYPQPRPQHTPVFSDFGEYRKAIGERRLRGRHKRRFAAFTEAELATVAAEIPFEQSTDRLVGLLMPFQSRQYPGSLQPLLELLTHEDRAVRSCARQILSRRPEGAVREAGLTYLRAGGSIRAGLELLASSFQEEDASVITTVVAGITDEHELHEASYGVQGICDYHDTPVLKEALLDLYHRSACGVCRYKLVRLLDKAGVLPAQVRRELAMDSSEDIREWARGK